MSVDGLRVAEDVPVVAQQIVIRQARMIEQVGRKLLVEAGYVVLIVALTFRLLHVMRNQVLETGHLEETQHPLGQYQSLLET
jgi:hypothetical protein